MWILDEEGLTQPFVDEYYEKTLKMVGDVESQEDAIELLKRIRNLQNFSELFFVPKDIEKWDDIAFSYIESLRYILRKSIMTLP